MDKNYLNLITAIILSVGIMVGWHYFYEKPRYEAQYKKREEYKANQLINNNSLSYSSSNSNNSIAIEDTQALEETKINRIKIASEALEGSINLKGLRFDDLILKRYKETLDENSPAVTLLKPRSNSDSYFLEIGWISNNCNVPNANTIWQADKEELTPSSPIIFNWINDDQVKFIVEISMDEDYLFTIKQQIINEGDKSLTVQPYGLINRNYSSKEKLVNILHQGPIGVVNHELKENSYENLKDKKKQNFAQAVVDWIGITDKYWLVAFLPDKILSYNANFNYVKNGNSDKYQVDFLAPNIEIAPGGKCEITEHIFAGAKKVDLLDKYSAKYKISLFDRAIDFGWFYALTKPVFNSLNFFYKYTNNFGVSILIVTIIIKLLMFTLATKSYRSIKKVKTLQPEIERIKSLYSNDKVTLNQEIMKLYKKEKVNPVSGCLPLLIQIPVFFSLYKVLYVTIEMRHAPFFGWIYDLSAPDPTNIFNMFGLLPFIPPTFLNIGAWPIIMAITMFLQQKMSPAPADPVQEQVMKLMPLFFLIMFSSFPAGLLIYWSWNNILSIIQQCYINRMNTN